MAVDEDNSVHWEKTDQIGVYGTQTPNVPFSLKSLQSDRAEFTGDIDLTKEEVVLAYYPYQEDAVKDGNTLTVTLPSEYVYKGNSNAPMIGRKTDDGTFVFKHTCGLMRITLGDLPADAERFVITSCGENAPSIAGQAVISDITADDAVIRLDEEQGKEVIYHLDKLTDNNGLRHFFVPLPVGNYKRIEVSLYGSQNSEPHFTRSVSNIKVERADMIEMPVINGNTGECYVLSEGTIPLTEETAANVTLSTTDNRILIYDVRTAAEDIPQVGQIIISGVQESLPYGFLGKVTSVTKNQDGSHTVTTKTPGLFEAFDKLYVNENTNIEFDEAQTRGSSLNLKGGIFGELDLSSSIPIKIKNDSLQANGELKIGGIVTVNINYDKDNKMNYCAVTCKPNITLGVQCGLGFEKDGNVKKKVFEKRSRPIILADGFIWIFPTISSYIKAEVEGKVIASTSIEYETRFTTGILYKNGTWQRGIVREKPLTNQESPWNFGNHCSCDGKLSFGIDLEFGLKWYNLDNWRVYIGPELACDLEGCFDINSQYFDESLEKALENTKLNSSLYVAGKVGADFSVFALDESSKDDFRFEQELIRLTLLDSELSPLPSFKELMAKVQSNNGACESSINTELTGEVLSKDMKVELVVTDKEGNEVDTSTPVSYNGGKTFEEDPDVIVPLENNFTGLQENTEYKVFPRVTSPLFAEVAEGGVVDLKKQAVPFTTYNSIRDVLVKIYNECGGKNWEHQKNWCSDAPVSEWEGVFMQEDGSYYFDFVFMNNLTGTLSIIDCGEKIGLPDINYVNCEMESLFIKNCPNLTFIGGKMEFPNVKSIHIENINKEADMFFYGWNMPLLQEVYLKDCGGVAMMVGEDSPVWESIYCENIKPSLNLRKCNLKTIELKNCNDIFAYILNCNCLEEVSFSTSANGSGAFDIRGSHIKKLTYNLDLEQETHQYGMVSFDLAQMTGAEFDIQIDTMSLYGGHTTIHFDVLKCSYIEGLDIDFYSVRDLLDSPHFKNIHGLKTLIGCAGHNADFSGCEELEYVEAAKSWTDLWGTLDIRNTPKLRYFDCSHSRVTKILLDSHFNYVDLNCSYCHELLQQIPDFYNPSLGGGFIYDKRYAYTGTIGGTIGVDLTVEDRGYGWWYAGEPERGYHNE